MAVAAAQAVEHVGLPEVRLNLAQATIYLATRPEVEQRVHGDRRGVRGRAGLRPRAGAPARRELSRGEADSATAKGYRYPHDFPGHAVEQDYRPASLSDRRYYEPSGQGDDVAREPGTGRRLDEGHERRMPA